MELREYLSLKKITPEQFGLMVDASTGGVRKWLSGERTPKPSSLRKIHAATKGAVTALDFVQPLKMAG